MIEHSGMAKLVGLYLAMVLSKRERRMVWSIRQKSRHGGRRKHEDEIKSLYEAPKLLLGSEGYKKESDVWCMGCLPAKFDFEPSSL